MLLTHKIDFSKIIEEKSPELKRCPCRSKRPTALQIDRTEKKLPRTSYSSNIKNRIKDMERDS